MIKRVHSFFIQKILIIIFIFCIFVTYFSFLKIASNKIIIFETDIYSDIDVKSIINTYEKYDVSIYYPVTKNKKTNREIQLYIDKRIDKLEYEAKYYIPKDSKEKLNLLIQYRVEKANDDIVSFIFTENYSQGKLLIYSKIYTKTYNTSTGEQIYLSNFFDKRNNYLNELCEISKTYLMNNNNLDKKVINWFIDDINNSLQNSFDGYSFSSSYLTIYFNSNKISSNLLDVYEIKIPWKKVKHLLKSNTYIN